MQTRTTCLRPSDYLRTPWKNGLGFTDQIAIDPPGADLRRADFFWRLSSARIERSSPFSTFPNHDRVLILVEGEGASVTHRFDEESEPEVVELRPLEPYEFPGDVPTVCQLGGGPIQDLSVFFAKGHAEVRVERLQLEAGARFSWEPRGQTQFLYVVRGEITSGGSSARVGETLRSDLSAGSGDQPECQALAGMDGADALLIQIEQAR